MDPARLKSIPLFAELSGGELERVASLAERAVVPERETLASEGESAYTFFLIEEGTAEVEDDGRIIAELGPGDFFGEIGLLTTERRTARVTSTSPMKLIVMFSRQFREMTTEFPAIAEKLRNAVQERLARS